MTYINMFSSRKLCNLYKLSDEAVYRQFEIYLLLGFAIFSPYQANLSNHENDLSAQRLAKKIKKAGFNYIPVYTGIIENAGTENEEYRFITFFIITQFSREHDGIMHGDSVFMNFIHMQLQYFKAHYFMKGRLHYSELYTDSNFHIKTYHFAGENLNQLIIELLRYHLKTYNCDYFSTFDFASCTISPFCNPPISNRIEGLRRFSYGEIELKPGSFKNRKKEVSMLYEKPQYPKNKYL